MQKVKFTAQDVEKIAGLAQIPITDQEKNDLAKGFNQVIEVVDKLFEVDTRGVEPTSQVTGLENVSREDEIDTERMFTQAQALQNAKATHNGFFMVKQVIDQE